MRGATNDAGPLRGDAASPSPAPSPAPHDAVHDAVSAIADAPLPDRTEVGPFELPFDGKRNVYYVLPRSRHVPARLLANLHGLCNPPGYACGYWIDAASRAGLLVCPEGNARCGKDGPPTWTQPIQKTDDDLEHAIAAVEAHEPDSLTREGAVLTGFSLGAWSAVGIAKRHPGRWPFLVLVEADVPLDAASLRRAGVRAVGLVAGERGTQIQGEKRTAEKLQREGFAARFWIMRGAGHHYSADIDRIMAEAVAFVTGEGGSETR